MYRSCSTFYASFETGYGVWFLEVVGGLGHVKRTGFGLSVAGFGSGFGLGWGQASSPCFCIVTLARHV
jgi:hypothetical protein